KLDQVQARFEEISALLSDAETMADVDEFRSLSKEYARLEPVMATFAAWRRADNEITVATPLLRDPDPAVRTLAADEIADAEARRERLEQDLQVLLLPHDPNDAANLFLEIRAGAGGDEAALFAGVLFRMYSRYAETQGWQVEVLSGHDGEHGGYKEVIARVIGDGAYSKLK